MSIARRKRLRLKRWPQAVSNRSVVDFGHALLSCWDYATDTLLHLNKSTRLILEPTLNTMRIQSTTNCSLIATLAIIGLSNAPLSNAAAPKAHEKPATQPGVVLEEFIYEKRAVSGVPCIDNCRNRQRLGHRLVWWHRRKTSGRANLDFEAYRRSVVAACRDRERRSVAIVALSHVESGAVSAEERAVAAVLQIQVHRRMRRGDDDDLGRRRCDLDEAGSPARGNDRPGEE